MGRTPRDITDAELAVLEALWDRGDATIRQLTDALYAGGGTSAYGTVQKLLERLEEKGAVVRERSGTAHRFRPTIERGELIGRRLQDVADQLCGGSLTPLLTHLVKRGELNSDDRQTLRDLVEQLAKANNRSPDTEGDA